MAGYGMYNPNQNMINQLLRQKDSVENLIQQYSQMPQQAPIQNIINQGTNLEFEARILSDGEDISNIGITRKTLFVDEKNKKVAIKELDGTISKEYEIIVPLDEKDKKILELEKRLKEMEDKIYEHSKPSRTNGKFEQSNVDANGDVKSESESNSKQLSKSNKRETSGSNSENV